MRSTKTSPLDTDDQLNGVLRKSFKNRAQAIFYGRLAILGLYSALFLLSQKLSAVFPTSSWDLAIIIAMLIYSSLCYILREHRLIGRWIHYITLIIDLICLIIFTRSSGYLLSPLMAIKPFLTAGFILLFHNSALLIPPIAAIPITTFMCRFVPGTVEIISIIKALAIYVTLDILAILFIHLTNSKEHGLLAAIISMQQKLKNLAIVDERQRIARELHDGIGAQITSIVMQCDYLQLKRGRDLDVAKEIMEIRRSALDSIDDVRRSIAFLHGRFDIAKQTRRIIDDWRQSSRKQIEDHGIDGLSGLELSQQLNCCRIIQEALTNAVRHANAQRISVTARVHRDLATLTIEDDGTGFDINLNKKDRYGIKNMRERASSMGGDLELSSSPEGTRISLCMPLSGRKG